ncbi:33867_t:CDS:1, partial [Gigaspora margarita]
MIHKCDGYPKYKLSQYVNILSKTNPNDKSCQCIYKACAEILKEEAQVITNRKERIKKHLLECEHFWNKYGKEVAEEILKSCDSSEELEKMEIDN